LTAEHFRCQQFAAAPNRYLVVAENSSHDIAVGRPDVLADAVNGLVKRLG
jgi:hypothetical protein